MKNASSCEYGVAFSQWGRRSLVGDSLGGALAQGEAAIGVCGGGGCVGRSCSRLQKMRMLLLLLLLLLGRAVQDSGVDRRPQVGPKEHFYLAGCIALLCFYLSRAGF